MALCLPTVVMAQGQTGSASDSPTLRKVRDTGVIVLGLAVLLILLGLWWAVHRGQFENVEQEGERILRDG